MILFELIGITVCFFVLFELLITTIILGCALCAPKRIDISFFFASYDGWCGYFWNREKRALYLCPLPWCVFKFQDKGSI